MEARLILDIQSFWHAGTGRGSGTDLDAVVHRTAAGLPFLPGRTVSGLLRDVVQQAHRLGAYPDSQLASFRGSPATWCFGTGLERVASEDRVQALEEARFLTEPGNLLIDSARLGDDRTGQRSLEAWAQSNKARLEHLFRPFASTRLNEQGVAEDNTLRAIEVTVPVKLCAFVRGPDAGPDWRAILREALPLLRSLGSHRHRGLGRVKATLELGAGR